MWQRITGILFRLIFPALLVAVSFAKGQLSNLPITTTLTNTDSSGASADIQSDGPGSYFDGVEAVTSFLTTNGYNGIVWGDWQFGTLNSTTRKVGLSFANPFRWPTAGPRFLIRPSPSRTLQLT